MGDERGGPGEGTDELLRRDETALYDAKLGGRKRVVGAYGAPLKTLAE
jgi:PleD family two-component response regulator